ncbi:ABC transporter permease [Paraliomyxa miuraensis]|uniref:ABC transporter permease n=1 Tax=Paraliomyxa miuraensis TaxID=376150 RepID=UPI002256C533|nr:ABC transporter permease [Paraliomyxa miuraensis]MCX4248028.1 ABC transporter permease [Paraliomyxa miuraensis]
MSESRASRASRGSRWPSPGRLLLSLTGVLAFVLLWHLATLGNSRTDIPGPYLTVQGLVELIDSGQLLRNVVASLFRVAWGFVLAVALGIPLGLSIGWYRTARLTLNPVIQMLRPISPIAWLPMATLIFGASTWFDASDLAAIFLIFLSSFFPIVTATASAVASVELKYLRSAINFGVRGHRLVTRVILPSSLPQILTGLRLALGIAWVVVVAAEMLGVQSGLGFQVNDARNNLRYDLVSAAMVVIGVTGLAIDGAMASLQSHTLRRMGQRMGQQR